MKKAHADAFYGEENLAHIRRSAKALHAGHGLSRDLLDAGELDAASEGERVEAMLEARAHRTSSLAGEDLKAAALGILGPDGEADGHRRIRPAAGISLESLMDGYVPACEPATDPFPGGAVGAEASAIALDEPAKTCRRGRKASMEQLCAGWDGGKVGSEWGGPDVGAEVVE